MNEPSMIVMYDRSTGKAIEQAPIKGGVAFLHYGCIPLATRRFRELITRYAEKRAVTLNAEIAVFVKGDFYSIVPPA